ncbi:MAG: hypothetical protein ABI824_14630 [Acidobacteriota bacterium]
MKRMRVLGLLMLCTAAANAANCDRACLKNMLTTYLNALVAQDPSKVPLDAKVRFTEDSKDLKVGEGFWKTATKLGNYRQDFIDVKEQVAATHVIVEESGKPAMFTARIKVAKGKITEIETLVTHGGDRMGGNAGNLVVRPDMGVEPPASQKNKRADLIKIADHYPRGLTLGGFDKVDTPFSTDAFRIENGSVMAGPGCGRGGPGGPAGQAKGPGPAPATPKGAGKAKGAQDVAGCLNMKTQGIIEHPTLTKSIVAVDEEQGIVLMWMNFGDTGNYGEGNALVVFEAFKAYGDQLRVVQAFMKVLPKDTKRGWGTTVKGADKY